jgi:hypothetical protein
MGVIVGLGNRSDTGMDATTLHQNELGLDTKDTKWALAWSMRPQLIVKPFIKHGRLLLIVLM